ncbi:MAG: DUF1127 domain-containing protein [Rhodopila sp.]
MSQSISAAFASARAHRRGALGDLVAAVRLVVRTQSTRHALRGLTDRELADIGVSRATAMDEADRMPWDLAPRRYR